MAGGMPGGGGLTVGAMTQTIGEDVTSHYWRVLDTPLLWRTRKSWRKLFSELLHLLSS